MDHAVGTAVRHHAVGTRVTKISRSLNKTEGNMGSMVWGQWEETKTYCKQEQTWLKAYIEQTAQSIERRGRSEKVPKPEWEEWVKAKMRAQTIITACPSEYCQAVTEMTVGMYGSNTAQSFRRGSIIAAIVGKRPHNETRDGVYGAIRKIRKACEDAVKRH